MTRTRPISTTPRVHAGCGAAALFLFGGIFLTAGLGAGLALSRDNEGPLSLLFPIPFVAFGLFALIYSVVILRHARTSRRGIAGASGSASRLASGSSGGVTVVQGTMHDHRFSTGAIAQTIPTGPLVLTAGAARLGRFGLLLFVCLFWNGIVGVFTYLAYFKDDDGSTWALRLFLLLFQAVGLGILFGLANQFLVLFNPRPKLTLGNGRPRLGESLTLQWELSGAAGRLRNLRIELVGKEEAAFRRGTDTVRDTHIFHRSLVAEARDDGRIVRGMTAMTIPSNTMHSFDATNNKIIWALQVTGALGWWPDLDETFEISVIP